MRAYLSKNDIPVKMFAAELGISMSYLYQLLKKERRPSIELARKIEKITNGELTVDALRGDAKDYDLFSPCPAREQIIESKIETIHGALKILDQRIYKLEKKQERD